MRANDREILIVCHGFEDTDDEFSIPIEKGFQTAGRYGRDIFCMEEDRVIVKKMEEWTAGAVYLIKK